MKHKYTDKELLDYLQKLNDEKVYSGRCEIRKSFVGGWALMEAGWDNAVSDVRQAIINFMEGE